LVTGGVDAEEDSGPLEELDGGPPFLEAESREIQNSSSE